MTNDEGSAGRVITSGPSFVIRISDFLRHWVFRHSSFAIPRLPVAPAFDLAVLHKSSLVPEASASAPSNER